MSRPRVVRLPPAVVVEDDAAIVLADVRELRTAGAHSPVARDVRASVW